jgi:hypothetical protein
MTQNKVDFVSLQGPGKVSYEMILKPELSPRGFQWKSSPTHGWLGSYRIEGDKLTLIFQTNATWTNRPTDFTGKPEYRFVLRRMP